ncbi:MAG: tRNA (guanosine(46)-N7)-methyltransferase TrmB, partial [Ruminococcus sp.]|nr:tRNA (guanosine(46)-N7)-methyltransferase TrmB [Ruminococcus sp.]
KKRRLTYPRKLEMYKSFLSPDAEIRFKTDDDGLFEESVEYFNECGYEITYITRDLHRSGFEGNIMTEHEKMFSDEGKKIKFLIAKQK